MEGLPGLSILIGILALALAIAAGFSCYVLADTGRDLAVIVRDRWRERRRRTVFSFFDEEEETPEPGLALRPRRAPWRILPLIAGLALALYVNVQAPLIAFSLLIGGLAVSLYLGPRTRAGEDVELSDQVQSLVEEVRAQYPVTPMPFACLAQVVGSLEDPLRGLVAQVVEYHRMHTDDEKALGDLVRAGQNNRYLAFLAYVLEQATRAGPDAVGLALENLETRLRDRQRLRQRAAVVLRMVTVTIRTLQGALVASLLAALFIPLFADFFFSTWGRQVIYVVVLMGAMAASVYFDHESHRLRGGLS